MASLPHESPPAPPVPDRIVLETAAAILGGQLDMDATLGAMARAAQRSLGSDRASCFVHDGADTSIVSRRGRPRPSADPGDARRVGRVRRRAARAPDAHRGRPPGPAGHPVPELPRGARMSASELSAARTPGASPRSRSPRPAIGGEEFGWVLRGTDAGALVAVERAREAIAARM